MAIELPNGIPAEIWHVVIRHIVTVWPRTSFTPYQDSKRNIDGFRRSCKHFQKIVDSVMNENQVLKDYDYFIFLEKPCHAVQCMRINEPPRARLMLTSTFYEALSDYLSLRTLSICTSEPEFTCTRLSSLSFSNNLRRLDLRTVRRHDRFFWESVTISMPNLRELRLGSTEFLRSERMASVFRITDTDVRGSLYTDLNKFVSGLASRLSGCPNLRLLSLHLMLTSSSSPDAPQNFFNKHETIQKEDEAALILARSLPKLEEVIWVNPWVDESYDDKNASCRIARHSHEGSNDGEGVEDVEVVRDSEAYAGIVPPSAGIMTRAASCGATWLL